MNEQQVAKGVNDLFEKYDTNKNGVLERGEVRQLLVEIFKRANRVVSEVDVDRFIDLIDQNRDRMISRTEMIQMFSKAAEFFS